jgi:hypothetical protein
VRTRSDRIATGFARGAPIRLAGWPSLRPRQLLAQAMVIAQPHGRLDRVR